jgi:hypothetical protein
VGALVEGHDHVLGLDLNLGGQIQQVAEDGLRLPLRDG